jgi:hypothetical protein
MLANQVCLWSMRGGADTTLLVPFTYAPTLPCRPPSTASRPTAASTTSRATWRLRPAVALLDLGSYQCRQLPCCCAAAACAIQPRSTVWCCTQVLERWRVAGVWELAAYGQVRGSTVQACFLARTWGSPSPPPRHPTTTTTPARKPSNATPSPTPPHRPRYQDFHELHAAAIQALPSGTHRGPHHPLHVCAAFCHVHRRLHPLCPLDSEGLLVARCMAWIVAGMLALFGCARASDWM